MAVKMETVPKKKKKTSRTWEYYKIFNLIPSLINKNDNTIPKAIIQNWWVAGRAVHLLSHFLEANNFLRKCSSEGK